jgi:hypothetical protein
MGIRWRSTGDLHSRAGIRLTQMGLSPRKITMGVEV